MSCFPLPCLTLRPVSACSGPIPVLRLAARPSACSNDVSTVLPHFPRLPRFPAFRRPCFRFPIPRAMITGARIQLYSTSCLLSSPRTHPVDGRNKAAHLAPYYFTCHDVCVRLVCLISGLCKDATSLWSATRERGRRDEYVIRCHGSRRVLLDVRGVLFRVGSFSVSCRRVLALLFHSFRTHLTSFR